VGRHDLMSPATTGIGCVTARITTRVAGIISAVVIRSVDWTACAARLHHAGASELTGSARGSHRGAAMVLGSKLRAVIVRCHFVLLLQASGSNVPVVLRGEFAGGWADVQSTCAPIVADAIHGEVVHHRAVVNVGEVPSTEIVHRPVIEESSAPPFAAYKAHAIVAEPVVDPTVEANVRSPIARMKDKGRSTPTPIPGGPQETHLRGHHPSAGNPIVAVYRIIGPITRRPHVPRRRANRLRINWDGRRSDAHRNAYGN
jgi:hypothetical protein